MRSLGFCLLLTTTALADLLGPTYPPPVDLTSDNSKIKKAWDALSSAFDSTLKRNTTAPGFELLASAANVTFSASLFSLHDAAATDLQYHYTAPQVANSEFGTQDVDSDSIYRVASVTKLITVLAGLIELTDAQWRTPLSEIFPELVESGNWTKDPVSSIQWDEITPWTLANQLAGLPTTGLPPSDAFAALFLTANTTNASLASLAQESGFRPLTLAAFGPCIDPLIDCTREEFIQTIGPLTPVQSPWTTSGYSNLNFMVLGAAISKFTGKPFDVLYEDAVFGPLSMDSSYANAPTSGPAFNDRSVVVSAPGVLAGSWTFAKNNPSLSSGGILSTIADLNKLGLALANSTLLDPALTREWMKPHSHTASLTTSIGAPWEIVRYVNPETGKVTDIYTKLGDSGAYGGQVAIIPDYGCGWTFLNAYYEVDLGTNVRSPAALVILNYIAEAIIPALEAQAEEEAVKNFVGTYLPEDKSINSSITIGFNNSDVPTSLSGMSVDKWISYDVDMVEVQLGGERPYLQPSRFNQAGDGSGEIAFRMSIYPVWNTYLAANLGPFTGFYDAAFDTWAYEGTTYGSEPVRSLIFNVDSDGRAKSVYIPSLRLTLKKAESEAEYIMRGLTA